MESLLDSCNVCGTTVKLYIKYNIDENFAIFTVEVDGGNNERHTFHNFESASRQYHYTINCYRNPLLQLCQRWN